MLARRIAIQAHRILHHPLLHVLASRSLPTEIPPPSSHGITIGSEFLLAISYGAFVCIPLVNMGFRSGAQDSGRERESHVRNAVLSAGIRITGIKANALGFGLAFRGRGSVAALHKCAGVETVDGLDVLQHNSTYRPQPPIDSIDLPPLLPICTTDVRCRALRIILMDTTRTNSEYRRGILGSGGIEWLAVWDQKPRNCGVISFDC
jgi:hypothetical protein